MSQPADAWRGHRGRGRRRDLARPVVLPAAPVPAAAARPAAPAPGAGLARSWSSSSPPTWPSWPGRGWSAGASTRSRSSTRTHDAAPLVLLIVGVRASPCVVQALTTRAYIGGIGRLGDSVVLELRRRLFAQFQRLPIAFHERYTSGRVISRQVSDIDSIQDLFEDGLDTLVSAMLHPAPGRRRDAAAGLAAGPGRSSPGSSRCCGCRPGSGASRRCPTAAPGRRSPRSSSTSWRPSAASGRCRRSAARAATRRSSPP